MTTSITLSNDELVRLHTQIQFLVKCIGPDLIQRDREMVRYSIVQEWNTQMVAHGREDLLV